MTKPQGRGRDLVVRHMCLIKDGPHPDKAYDMLDPIFSVDSGLFYMNDWDFGHSNQRAFDQVSDGTLAALQLPRDPTELLESGVLYCRFKDKDKVIERFQTMKAGF